MKITKLESIVALTKRHRWWCSSFRFTLRRLGLARHTEINKIARNVKIMCQCILLMLLSIVSVPSFAFQADEPYKISHEFDSNTDAENFEITPDGKRVVYFVRTRGIGTHLYSVSIGGGKAINLTPELELQDGLIKGFKISPDSSKVVYQLTLTAGKGESIHLVNIDGSGYQQLAATETQDVDARILRFLISSDSSRIAFTLFKIGSTRPRLYYSKLIPPYNSGRVGISQGFTSVENDFEFLPGYNSLIYRADVVVENMVELFISSTDTPNDLTRINVPLDVGGDVEALADGSPAFSISSDGKYVVYKADAEKANVTDLYSTQIINGSGIGARKKLNSNNLAIDENVFRHLISPDNSRVIYVSDEGNDTHFVLFSVPIDGGASAIRISHEFPTGTIPAVRDIHLSPDSETVVYFAEDKLYSSNIFNIESPVPLTPTLFYFPEVSFDRSGKTVVYLSRQGSALKNEIYRVSINGSNNVALSRFKDDDQNTLGFLVDKNSNRVLYIGDERVKNQFEFFGGSTETVNVNVPLAPNFTNSPDADVVDSRLSADGQYFIYRADQDEDEKFELYAVKFLPDDDICFPIKAKNTKVAMVCL